MHDPFLLNQYQTSNPPRYWGAESFPIAPVNPNQLVGMVMTKLEEYGNFIPKKTPQMVIEMCKTFNECIRLNRSKDIQQIMILSPKTGSGKSLVSKAYIALLQEETSVIIVPRVSDAINFCKDINEWSDNSEYARCLYRVTETNPESPYRIDAKDVNQYRCVVMTHKMLHITTEFKGTTIAKELRNKPRDLVIVDERLTLYNPHEVSYEQIISIVHLLERVKEQTNYIVEDTLKKLIATLRLYTDLHHRAEEHKTNIIDVDGLLRDSLTVPTLDLSEILRLIESNIKLKDIYDPVSTKHSDIAEKSYRDDLKSNLESLQYILNNEFYYFRSGKNKLLISTNSMRQELGSMVVLDATASVNEIYNTLTYCNHMTSMHIETTDPRIYTNLTINVASGYYQSKSSIMAKDKDMSQEAKKYLSVAGNILGSDDKLLIVSHKAFRTILETQSYDDRIVFTHWGDHVGKNNWSDCNKIMLIGWYYLRDSTHYNNLVNAVGNQTNVSEVEYFDTIKDYRETQLADDLVQAIMRCSARKTIDIDGDCSISEVYLFRPDNQEGKAVIDIVIGEFRGAIVNEWLPKELESIKKNSKSHNNVGILLQYLESKSKSFTDVSRQTIIDETSLGKNQLTRIMKDEYFLHSLASLGFEKFKYNGKSEGIKFG